MVTSYRIDVGAIISVTSLVSNERTDSVESFDTFLSFVACTQSPTRAHLTFSVDPPKAMNLTARHPNDSEPIIMLNAVDYPASGTSRLDKFAWQMRTVRKLRIASVSVSKRYHLSTI